MFNILERSLEVIPVNTQYYETVPRRFPVHYTRLLKGTI
jgi:hypothetical protein